MSDAPTSCAPPPTLPPPPACYGTHSTSDYCYTCAAWSAFLSIPRLYGEIGALARAVSELREAVVLVRNALEAGGAR